MKKSIVYLFIVLCCSCTLSEKQVQPSDDGYYFSIKDFIKDQWQTYHGQPYGIAKAVYYNGKKDSLITNVDALNWGAILKIFFDTDISNPKFEGKYTFSQFSDSTIFTNNYYYEANDPSLFTQKLQITTDARNHKVVSVYIETSKGDRWGNKMQRLYYEPVKTISIQEFESSLTGSKNEVRVEYKFL